MEPWLTQQLGAPDTVTSSLRLSACEAARELTWQALGLVVGFTDQAGWSDGSPECLPEPILAAWSVGAPAPDLGPITVRASTTGGIGLGSTVDELTAAFPSVVFLAWNDSTFVPDGFYVPDGTNSSVALLGSLDWDWIRSLQEALNAEGATLAVDGVAGPRTRAALDAFRSDTGLADWWDTFRALDLTTPPPAARVTHLDAGQWFWELECGAMNLYGLEDC